MIDVVVSGISIRASRDKFRDVTRQEYDMLEKVRYRDASPSLRDTRAYFQILFLPQTRDRRANVRYQRLPAECASAWWTQGGNNQGQNLVGKVWHVLRNFRLGFRFRSRPFRHRPRPIPSYAEMSPIRAIRCSQKRYGTEQSQDARFNEQSYGGPSERAGYKYHWHRRCGTHLEFERRNTYLVTPQLECSICLELLAS